jgi:Cu-processing system ATP-binding protein
MITITNLTKSFGKLPVLRGIDLEFSRPGTISAILGPNGSGKTTLIKSVLGMVLPDGGEIAVNGRSVSGQWRYRAQIDYLPQIARFPENLRVRELVNLLRDLRGPRERSAELIEYFGLGPFLDQPLGTLSGGTRQKVNLTLAFMYDSPLLILDEPTSGLDPVALIRLKDFLRRERQRGKTMLITTHILDFVEEMADEIVFLLEGRIYFRGTQEELRERFGHDDLERAIAAILLGQARNDELSARRSDNLANPAAALSHHRRVTPTGEY